MKKVCKKCKIEKEFLDFYDCKGNRDGKSGSCKECTKKEVKQRAEQNPEKIKSFRKEYYSKKIRENPNYNRENRNRNLEKCRESDRRKYYKLISLNPEKKRAWSRDWARKRAEREPGYHKEYYKKNRERIMTYQKSVRKKHKDKINARTKLGLWVLRGHIQKPNICSKCNLKWKRIEAHHEDYSKPLDVIWVCRKCHVVLDTEKKKREKCKAALQGNYGHSECK